MFSPVRQQRIVESPTSAPSCNNASSLIQAAKPSIRQQLLAGGASDARRSTIVVDSDEEQVHSLLPILHFECDVICYSSTLRMQGSKTALTPRALDLHQRKRQSDGNSERPLKVRREDALRGQAASKERSEDARGKAASIPLRTTVKRSAAAVAEEEHSKDVPHREAMVTRRGAPPPGQVQRCVTKPNCCLMMINCVYNTLHSRGGYYVVAWATAARRPPSLNSAASKRRWNGHKTTTMPNVFIF